MTFLYAYYGGQDICRVHCLWDNDWALMPDQIPRWFVELQALVVQAGRPELPPFTPAAQPANFTRSWGSRSGFDGGNRSSLSAENCGDKGYKEHLTGRVPGTHGSVVGPTRADACRWRSR